MFLFFGFYSQVIHALYFSFNKILPIFLKKRGGGPGKAWGWGDHPIMHFKTGHSNSMQRTGNLPECEAGPRPRADKAKPAACGHSNLHAVLLGSCL